MQPGNRRDSAHRIRLRGPWNVQSPSQRRSGEVAVYHFQQTWGGVTASESGEYVFSRRFGSPTGVEPQQIVSLEVTSSAAGRAVLNEMDLGFVTPGTQSFEVTARLRGGNQIDLHLSWSQEIDDDTPIVEVAVVIETTESTLTPPPLDIPPSR